MAISLTKSQTRCWERVVSYYLRFNGYFVVDNFIVHDPQPGEARVPPATEVDTIAVRRPGTMERVLGQYEIAADARLIDRSADLRTDFVIAEAKAVEQGMVNRVWHSAQNMERHLETIAYILRRFGLDGSLDAAADLREHCVLQPRDADWRVRLVYFPFARSDAVAQLGWQQITLDDVIEFSVLQAQSWFAWELGRESIHREWDPIIVEFWSLCRRGGNDLHDRVRALFGKWDCAGSRISTEGAAE